MAGPAPEDQPAARLAGDGGDDTHGQIFVLQDRSLFDMDLEIAQELAGAMSRMEKA
jgi:hypothetical protein